MEKLHRSVGDWTGRGPDLDPAAELRHHGRCHRQHRPIGHENPGNLSINGQRESSNGFMVNGIDVQEHINGGTSIIPNLDSMEEFRVLTNKFDPEYGNYNGGMVTVVTKGESNVLHGNAFEFFRNTALDARGYFDPTRSTFKQNQFGGTVGGPIKTRQDILFEILSGNAHRPRCFHRRYLCAHSRPEAHL